ncbi:hypothetical protein MKW94_011692, partial [Papaver nudicaule]|nr:hypothetical protein [Papaver nudicaule]MCL7043226.1 hypothetical protein [Papaver nudicaule]
MARFSYFSCFRSSKVRIEEPVEGKDDHYGTGGTVEADDGVANARGGTVEADNGVANARVFKYTELSEATDSFDPSRVIGKGRLGCVYRGILEGGQEDMLAEVDILTCVDHPNLVKMIGYCDEEDGYCIVYEYVPLQSLNLHLHDLKPGKKPLDWTTRMKIAEGVAKALEYLHDQKDPPIVYGCVKTTGILLDEKYKSKLSDFSCVNHASIDGHATMYNGLTYGYVAHEYIRTGKLTLKSDVFNLGVILLELISGRKADDTTKIDIW